MKTYLSRITSSPLLWKLKPKGVYCFNYHRVGQASESFYDPNVFSCNEENFEKHLQFYKKDFDLITVDELNSLTNSKTRLKSRFALITFDDGYIDNYSLAFPLLKANNVPAVFFIATDFIEKDILPWWDEIAFLVKNSSQNSVQLENWHTPISLKEKSKESNVKDVLQRIKTDTSNTMAKNIENLKKSLGLEPDYFTPHKDLFMTWDMLKEMQANGMTIGSQSCSHSIMSHLSIEDQKYEALNSKKILSEKMNSEINSFAYPVGGISAFTQATENILLESEYSLGFSFIAGINRNLEGSRFHLKRFSVAGNCSVEQLKSQINKATLKWL